MTASFNFAAARVCLGILLASFSYLIGAFIIRGMLTYWSGPLVLKVGMLAKFAFRERGVDNACFRELPN